MAGSKWLLEPEMRNHEFAFNALRARQQQAAQEGLVVCVPEIFRNFEHRGFYFLVMEFVPGKTLRQILKDDKDLGAGQVDHSMLFKHIAEGIRLLICVKAPPGSKPGPVGGGFIRHPFFRDLEAPTPYRDIEMMETHLNKILKHRTRRSPKPTPTISLGTELQFYYSDLCVANFIFTTVADHTVLYIIDFGEAGFLPPIFMDFVIQDSSTRPWSTTVADGIVKYFQPRDEKNLQVMGTACYFVLSSSWYFGEKDGGGKPGELAPCVQRITSDSEIIQDLHTLKAAINLLGLDLREAEVLEAQEHPGKTDDNTNIPQPVSLLDTCLQQAEPTSSAS
ncbi:hypothetical protein KVR01_001491 [Diaporthe batatas]|uniref:uncharacterized protein n=1 Tax=Diaporthe batatas TaxID=748121 RepID=UPI001D048BFC|nr:uncharacterized protein KVR01_001491 [Diaporthe batatas]KAG8168742.1 hypothetical protein KVR01_001491 [Diaporthe batatas]